ncbi:hypothetical protein GC173_00400 [bacterium]|nr:hypothetical protein [bacterium]
MTGAAPRLPTVAIVYTTSLSADERRGFAALLLRAGIAGQVVEAAAADVVLLYGDESQLARPSLLIPRVATTSLDQHAALLKAPHELQARELQSSPYRQSTLGIDLVRLVADLLSPRLEHQEERDEHGRIAPSANLLHRLDQLDHPVVDELARAFLAIVCGLAGLPTPPPPVWTFCATFDIDTDGLLHPKRLARQAMELSRRDPRRLRQFAGDVAQAAARLKVDPEIRLRELGEQLEAIGVPATFLVQTHRWHRLDSYALRSGTPLARQLAHVLDNEFHEVGLHSSYTTSERPAKAFSAQWDRLRRVLGDRITPVHRAHYLRTRQAVYTGREESESLVDSSLGFGEIPGFRHGTCFPFATSPSVIELPPVAMDSTFIYHLRLSPERTFDRLATLMDRCRLVGGCFVLVMHPHHFHECVRPGWKALLFDLIRRAQSTGARFQGLADTARVQYGPAAALEKKLAGAPP